MKLRALLYLEPRLMMRGQLSSCLNKPLPFIGEIYYHVKCVNSNYLTFLVSQDIAIDSHCLGLVGASFSWGSDCPSWSRIMTDNTNALSIFRDVSLSWNTLMFIQEILITMETCTGFCASGMLWVLLPTFDKPRAFLQSWLQVRFDSLHYGIYVHNILFRKKLRAGWR